MTSLVVTVTEDTSDPVIAELFERNQIKRVLVLRDGRVVGIVRRADIIRALARAPDDMIELI